MFTSKESKLLMEIFDNIELEEVIFPEYKFPSWFPENLQNKVLEQETFIKSLNKEKLRKFTDVYAMMVEYFNLVLPIFTDVQTKDMWIKLNKISSAKTENFINYIFFIANDFDGAISLYQKHLNEKECFIKILQKISELEELLEEYECHFYGHMLSEEFEPLKEKLQQFKEQSIPLLEDFQNETNNISYMNSNWRPITREYKSENALPIFFARKLSLYFKKEFNKPYNRYVAETELLTIHTKNRFVTLLNVI
ncbi:MAG: hypothetical protein NC200_00485 [Candidatus Gastranaerophilales bacterium]|nr:hypothetical protein [Candidatus Gastranaerophilales bacterium]